MNNQNLLAVIGNPAPTQEGRSTVYLITMPGKGPITLGEGKFARVYLGATSQPPEGRALDPGEFVAIKFLKRDTTSTAVTKNGIFRFCREVTETARACRRGLARDALVQMYGYGRFAELPPTGDPVRAVMEEGFGINFDEARTSAHEVFGTLTMQNLDEQFRQNAANLEGGDISLTDLTGDFYVLELCLMTLEEILLARGNPYERSAGTALEAAGVSHAPVLQQRSADLDRMKIAERSLSFGSLDTGFEDLNRIQIWLNQRRGLEEGRFAGAALFELWQECAKRLQVLHAVPLKNGHVGLAHRDLKPANILVQVGNDLHLRLADLGFLASVTDIADGHFTLVSSVDEGGALPTGSKGFRAPEQMQTGDEISFIPLQPQETQVQLLSYFDEDIFAGDWIRVSGTFADQTAIARIVGPLKRDDDHPNRYDFHPPFVGPADVSKARLIPDVSLHSDVFSLGALAYFLASEGRNPERFYRQYLDETVLRSFGASLPKWVLQSPIWFAAVLCQDLDTAINTDIEVFSQALVADSYKELDADQQTYLAHQQILQDALGGASAFLRGDARKIHKFRKGLRDSEKLTPLLTGRVSVRAITFPFLAAILLCCMRDKKGSVVRRDTQSIGNQTKELSGTDRSAASARIVYAPDAHLFAARIVTLAGQLAHAPSVSDRSQELAVFGQSAREKFLRLRLAGNRPPVPKQKTSGAQAKGPRKEVAETVVLPDAAPRPAEAPAAAP